MLQGHQQHQGLATSHILGQSQFIKNALPHVNRPMRLCICSRNASRPDHHILSEVTISKGPAGVIDIASSAIVKLQISPARSRLAQEELSGSTRGEKRAREEPCMPCSSVALSSGVWLRYMNASRSSSYMEKVRFQSLFTLCWCTFCLHWYFHSTNIVGWSSCHLWHS